MKKILILKIILIILIIGGVTGYIIYSSLTISKKEAENLALKKLRNELRDYTYEQVRNAEEQNLKDSIFLNVEQSLIEDFLDSFYVEQSYKKDDAWFVIISSEDRTAFWGDPIIIRVYSKDEIISPSPAQIIMRSLT